jgi:hypothetical protein
VIAEHLHNLASGRSTGAPVPSESPVEGKGYKNIMNLPDWSAEHEILLKSEKTYRDGDNISPICALFQLYDTVLHLLSYCELCGYYRLQLRLAAISGRSSGTSRSIPVVTPNPAIECLSVSKPSTRFRTLPANPDP